MQENLNTVTSAFSKAGVGQTAGGAKELWSKQLVKTAVYTKCTYFFFADSSFDKSSFAPQAALTRLLFAPPAAWPLDIRKALNSISGFKLLNI